MKELNEELIHEFEENVLPEMWEKVKTTTQESKDGAECYHKLVQLFGLSYIKGIEMGATLQSRGVFSHE